MTKLKFNESRTFLENCEVFLDAMKSADPEMATILHDNWGTLLAIVQEGDRNSHSRSTFNASVVSALDAVVRKSREQGNES